MKNQAAKKNIGKYPGIYGDRLGNIITDSIYSELLETRSPQFGWEISPHVHPGLFQIFFIEKGTFYFSQANQRNQLSAPCILLIPPTAMHGFEFNDGVTGRILSIAESFFANLTEQMVGGFPVGDILTITEFSETYSPEILIECIKDLDREVLAQQTEKAVMLGACLQRLIVIILRLNIGKEPLETEKGNSASKHFRSFMTLLREHGNKTSIAELAAKLHITPIHLNRVCKTVAGKTAGQLQNDYLITEAKKCLSYTGHSVSEIAYLLHFEYPNYFARFFKKHTGQSPKTYRSKA